MDATTDHELESLAAEIAATEGRSLASARLRALARLPALRDTAAAYEAGRVAAWAQLMAYAAAYDAERATVQPLRLPRTPAEPGICAVAPGSVRFGGLIMTSERARRIGQQLVAAADVADGEAA